MVVGYTCGVYDLFHIGHLNLLKRAKAYGDYLIVAVSSDAFNRLKNKECIILTHEIEHVYQFLIAKEYIDFT